MTDDSFIAVIGMAGRFPGATGIEQFWSNLCRGVESVSLLPGGGTGGDGFVAGYGFLDGADEFDAEFFGYAPNDALIIDPQQRLFLECAHEALDRAGYGAAAGRPPVGVFAGGSTTDYRAAVQSELSRLPFVDEWQLRLATAPDFLATRVADRLALTGPAVAIQTACSTSLVAVHLAMQALLAGDCALALAGGAAVHLDPRITYTEGGIIAKDGHCRAFDADATGTVGGSAVAVVVLKPLPEALADGDHIHAVLRGSAANNDGGGKVGFSAPSVDGQARVIRTAQAVAGVDPDSIGYVEAHGTGTRLGDPIEVAALSKAFRARTDRRGYCALGSVKTNIGHTDAAAGVSGLIKAVLAVEHGLIPPSLHFRTPNPELDLDDSPFVVNDALLAWQPATGPRRAGVSSLGVGGTNAHVLVEEPPERPAPQPGRPRQLLVVSARTPQALAEASRRLAGHLGDHPGADLADVAWTLQVGREAYRHRRFEVCADAAGAAAAFAAPAVASATGGTAVVSGPEIVFMFPGQGGQHVHMARELYETEPVYRAAFDECAQLATPVLGLDLRGVLYPSPAGEQAAAERLATIEVGQPAVFAVEYSLARLLLEWGLRPRAVAGHSLGAYAAAQLAGVLTLPDAVRLVVRRGQLLQSLPAGAMAAVRLPEANVVSLLPAGLSVAAVNGPSQCTVSGPLDLVRAFAGELADRDVEARVLPIGTAGHSALVEPVVDEFRRVVDGCRLRPAELAFLSDTTGDWAAPEAVASGGYWAAHLRSPIRFGQVLSTLSAGPARMLVEVGPGRTLATLARQHPQARRHPAVQTLPHPLDETSALAVALGAVGHAWAAGAPIAWDRLHHGQRRRRVVLPTYPFARRRYRISGPEPAAAPPPPAAEPPPSTVDPAGGAVESVLRGAFAQALGLDDVGPADDFFQLGGDSLIATKLAAWARRRFDVTLAAVDIIRARTVRACAQLVEQRLRGTHVRR